MSPPIFNPNGPEVSEIVLPNGATASEVIDPDGNVVFEAGPDIPDTGLDHLWYGPEITDVSTYPDVVGNLDLSASGGPQLSDINDNQSVSYDGVDDEHAVSTAPAFGTDDVYTAVFVVDPTDTGSTEIAFNVGSAPSGGNGGYSLQFDFSTNQYRVSHDASEAVSGGSIITGPQVIVWSFDGSNTILDANGTEQINTTIANPLTAQEKVSISTGGLDNTWFEGVVGSAGHEAAFADSTRRDDLTQKLGDAFGISVSV